MHLFECLALDIFVSGSILLSSKLNIFPIFLLERQILLFHEQLVFGLLGLGGCGLVPSQDLLALQNELAPL